MFDDALEAGVLADREELNRFSLPFGAATLPLLVFEPTRLSQNAQ
jgi:hypothetical protein